MQQDLDRGRMVSDHELRHRLRLLGEQVRMLTEDDLRELLKPVVAAAGA